MLALDSRNCFCLLLKNTHRCHAGEHKQFFRMITGCFNLSDIQISENAHYIVVIIQKNRWILYIIHTGTEAGDPNVEEVRVWDPVNGLHLPLLPAPRAALAPYGRLPAAADEQRRLADAAGHSGLST